MISTRTNSFDSKRSTGKRRTTCTLGSVGTLALAGLLSSLLAIPVAQAIRVDGSPGDDTLEGTGGNDELFGYGGDDKLFGYGGNDRLEGGEGNDEIWGGAGADFIDGGAGHDWAVFNPTQIRPLPSTDDDLATGRIASGGYAQGDTLVGTLERLSGSAHDDRLTGEAPTATTGSSPRAPRAGRAGADSPRWRGRGAITLSYWQSDAGVTGESRHGRGDAASGGHASRALVAGRRWR